MNKYIYIKNPIYPFVFNVFINYTDKGKIKSKINTENPEQTKKIHKKIDKLKLQNVHARTFEKNGWIFIIIKDFNGSIDCYDTLHHEISHAVDLAACYIGIEQPKRVREFSAYLHGFVTKEIYKKIL